MRAKTVLFVPLTKVDVEQREVWGRAADETPDRAKEVFDFATSAPLFEAWSAGFEKATDGKSLGNVRAMHGKVAAGKVISFLVNTAEKAIDIGTKIVDDAEWAKVLEGVYTGFSIGGSYVKRWKDGELTRYTAEPAEISIVDYPCIPSATFAMVKAGGTVEQVPFKKGLWNVARLATMLEDVKFLAQDTAWEASVEGDDAKQAQDLKAWLDMGLGLLAAMVTEEGTEASADVAETIASATTAPAYAVGARVVATVDHMPGMNGMAGAIAEAHAGAPPYYAVNFDVPMGEGNPHKWLAEDEVVGESLAMATPTAGLSKVAPPAAAAADPPAPVAATPVAVPAEPDALAKATDEITALKGELAKLAEVSAKLAKAEARVVELEAMPMPAKGAVSTHAVSKAADSAIGSPALEQLDDEIAKTTDPQKKALLQIKREHAVGGQPLAIPR